MTVNASHAGTGRVAERRRAVALARHYREFEGLTIEQIADRLGRAPATIKAYFYDPTGEKARAVKARYQGACRGCGAYTQPRNGKGDAYAYCKACHPGAIGRRWTRELVLEAMREWRDRYGRLPSADARAASASGSARTDKGPRSIRLLTLDLPAVSRARKRRRSGRGGSRGRAARGLPEPRDPREDVFESGGELFLAIGYTPGGAPFGPRVEIVDGELMFPDEPPPDVDSTVAPEDEDSPHGDRPPPHRDSPF